jgi:hypothetical protein
MTFPADVLGARPIIAAMDVIRNASMGDVNISSPPAQGICDICGLISPGSSWECAFIEVRLGGPSL